MNDGKRVSRNPVLGTDPFVENVDGFAIFPNSRRKGDVSMLNGKDAKPNSSIRKKARKGSDDESDHGEGDGESEKESPKEHQEPSIDGNSVNQASQQGDINAKDENNKTEVGGSSTGKSKIISPKRLSGTNTRSASGFLGRRGSTPNPVYVKAKQQKRSLFRDQMDHYHIWLKQRKIWDPRPELNYDEVLLQCVADGLWNRRLAMILAIPLNHLPSLTIEDKIMRWADAVVKNLGVGVCWENFMCWCNSTTDQQEENKDMQWAFLAGRVFFYDLTTTVTSRKLTEAGRRQ
jgi:hypothetical protein